MRELRSRHLIIAKGVMFLGIALSVALLLLVERPTLRTGVLLIILVWSACRFYYFLFYALEKYVDPKIRYAGLLSLAAALRRRRQP